MMGNPRGLGTPVRLVPPAPVLVSASGNQQGMYVLTVAACRTEPFELSLDF